MGYDQSLVQELRNRLDLPDAVPMVEALAGIPIERFVRAFFEAAEPFVDMWEDLLALFERAAASTGSQQLDITYDFSAEQPRKLQFDLDHFRRTISRARQLMARFDLSRAEQGDLGAVSEAYRGDRDRYEGDMPSNPDVARFVHACEEERFPGQMPRRPISSDPRLDALVDETWLLGDVVLADLRAMFVDYRGVRASGWEPRPVPSGLPYSTLRVTASDHWLPTLVATATATLASGEPPSAQLVGALDAALQRLRNDDPTRTAPQERLEELLSLPLWKHRYDLYSNCVTTQVVAALDDQGLLVHSAAGRIEFSFRGTHLATFDIPMPRLHLWTEYRSALEDPVGAGRTGAIQPDIALRRDPITADLTPLVVECKQYRKADSRAFADALTDYARGHQDAMVVLVNYAGGRQTTILGKVAQEVRDRTAFVPHLRPHSPDALAEFRRLVRGAVGLAVDVGDESRDVGRIELSWGASPRDLDLRVRISGVAEWEIGWDSLGALDVEPYARLENDDRQGNGGEVVRITRWLPAIYVVEVVNYSNERPIGEGNAQVSVTLSEYTRRFECPPSLQDDRWEVCHIDGKTGRLTWTVGS